MINCFFVTDLHGHLNRYKSLFEEIEKDKPDIVFLGGDLLPNAFRKTGSGHRFDNFLLEYLKVHLKELRIVLDDRYPEIYAILGNDDAREEEQHIIKLEEMRLLKYINNKKVSYKEYTIYGYAYIPPTPFLLKDWEKYDVSRHVDPGCVSPEEGFRTVHVEQNKIQWGTIKDGLEELTAVDSLDKSVFLFHSPPYKTNLDRAALDGRKFEHVLVDVHIGSVAIRQFIAKRKPYLTLHGHVHESTRLTGEWNEKLDSTICFQGATDRLELSLIKFDLEGLDSAKRYLI